MNVSREQRRQLARDNAALPLVLTLQPRELWKGLRSTEERQTEVWRSRDFLLIVYDEGGGIERLSFLRTQLATDSGRWVDGIAWDDLQRLKRECGRGQSFAVEVYPPDRDLVNVANMRHLWVLPAPLPFAWRKHG